MKVYKVEQKRCDEIIANTSNGKRIISQGVDNQLPYLYLELLNSTIHSAILQTKNFYIVGDGISGGEVKFNTLLESKDIILKMANDLTLYNGYALKVIYSKDISQIVNIEHIPLSNVRYSVDINGNIDGVVTSDDQNGINRRKVKPIHYPLFNPLLAETEPIQILLFNSYTPMQGYYPIPSYYGAIKYIDIDMRLATFHLNNVKRGFFPSTIITFPSRMLDEEQEREVVKNFEDFYIGEKEVKALFLFGEPNADGEIRSPHIESFEASKNVDLFNQLNELSTQKIITSHQLTSPVLASLPGAGSLGGNSSEILIAYDLFYNKVIKVFQNQILKGLNMVTKYNNIPEISIKNTQPLSLEDKNNNTNDNPIS